MIGTLNAQTLKLVATFPATVNSETLAEHFVRVSEATQIEADRLGIKLRHLPLYSPNLNLIERAWKVMNEQVRNNVYFPDEKVFSLTIKDFSLNRWSKLAESLTTRFADHFQIIQKLVF